MTIARFLRAGLGALFSAALLSACQFSFNSGTQQPQVTLEAGDPAEQKSALAAAEGFARMVDAGQYDHMWEQSGAALKAITPRTQWNESMGKIGTLAGTVRSRKFSSEGFTPTLGGNAPPGHYAVVFFETQFEKGKFEEKVVLDLQDGKWRLVGYFLTMK